MGCARCDDCGRLSTRKQVAKIGESCCSAVLYVPATESMHTLSAFAAISVAEYLSAHAKQALSPALPCCPCPQHRNPVDSGEDWCLQWIARTEVGCRSSGPTGTRARGASSSGDRGRPKAARCSVDGVTAIYVTTI